MTTGTYLRAVLFAALAVLVGCAPPPPPELPPRGTPAPTLAEEVLGVVEPLPARRDPLQARIEAAVKHVRSRDLHTTDRFWAVFHGILGLGPDVQIVDADTKQRTNAFRYIFDGGALRGLQFLDTPDGLDVVTVKDGQGHQDQFAAEMAQWGTPLTEPVTVNGKPHTFDDFVRFSQRRVRTTQTAGDPTSNQELSWAIILVAQYRGTEVQWKNAHGEALKFEDVVRYELNAPVEGRPGVPAAACGGTHRLFGLTWARHLHLGRGGRDEGVWRQIAEKNDQYRAAAKRFQSTDGYFSSSYLAKTPLAPQRPRLPGADGAFGTAPMPGHSPERFQRINATGHVVEWLAFALPDDELREPWVVDAVNALCLMILDLEDDAFDAAIYHAIHGLYIYYARVYGYGSFVPPRLLVPLPPGWKVPAR